MEYLKNHFLPSRFWCLVVFSFIFFISCSPLYASLGDAVNSIDQDQKLISGVKSPPVSFGSYDVLEIHNTGLSIREYVSSTGVVFAITWKGINHPDLSSLLSAHYSDYENTCLHSQRVRGFRFRRVFQGSDIVVEKFGHMRAMQGKAYMPSLLPEGIHSNDIR